MRTRTARATLLADVCLLCAGAQELPDWSDLARLKEFSAHRSSSNNADLSSNDDSKRPIPGETIVLADLRGPGVVTHIWLTVAANEYGWPRLMRLRVYYDGSATASVDAPLGDFFAVGHGVETPVESLVVRDGSSGRSRNSYWPMPFARRCRITLTNEGRRRVSNVYYHVDWKKLPALPPGTAYFHARYRQELPAAAGRRYEILNVRGRGHYVGTVLSVIQNQPGWFGEGDEYFFVDGARKPSIEGTGTEDYFNDAWSLRVSQGAYTGVPMAEGTGLGARLSAYRWHLPDPVPFKTALRFEIEHVGWTYNADGTVRSASEERADLYSSVAFWYQAGIATGLPAVPYGSARLPHGNAIQLEAEDALDSVRAEDGAVSIQKEVFWSRDLLFFDPKGAGGRLHVPFEVERDGRYELLAQVAHSPDSGRYRVMLDGKPLADSTELEHEPGANTGAGARIDAYHTELYVAADHLLGWPELKRGRHVVTFECTGKDARSSGFRLGLDTLVLARVASAEPPGGAHAERIRQGAASLEEWARAVVNADADVRAAALWRATQDPALAVRELAALQRSLADSSAEVRGLAAVALRSLGARAAAAAGALAEGLADTDPGVRMTAASALAAIGPKAVPALQALLKACDAPGEHVHVQRSLADALGAIGTPAREALPALRRFRQLPRVRWNADAAIARIEGAR